MLMKEMEVFISHSRKDEGLVNRIYKAVTRAGYKRPNIAEFEELEESSLTAEEIVDMIHRSSLFLLFLTQNVMEKIHTQNWVSFELGCAYGAKTKRPLVRKDIYVFEPTQQVNFPIPYLDYYVLFDPNTKPHWQFIEGILFEEREYWSRVFPLLFGQRPSDRVGVKNLCTGCGSKFTLLSQVERFLCPTCRRVIQ